MNPLESHPNYTMISVTPTGPLILSMCGTCSLHIERANLNIRSAPAYQEFWCKARKSLENFNFPIDNVAIILYNSYKKRGEIRGNVCF